MNYVTLCGRGVVEQGVVHQSVTTRTKMSDDIGKMGRLKLANYRVTYFVDGRAFLYVGIVFFPRQSKLLVK